MLSISLLQSALLRSSDRHTLAMISAVRFTAKCQSGGAKVKIAVRGVPDTLDLPSIFHCPYFSSPMQHDDLSRISGTTHSIILPNAPHFYVYSHRRLRRCADRVVLSLLVGVCQDSLCNLCSSIKMPSSSCLYSSVLCQAIVCCGTLLALRVCSRFCFCLSAVVFVNLLSVFWRCRHSVNI